MVLSGGRLCTEHMTGLFLWLNLKGTRDGEWQRYSLSYQHNVHWDGDPSYKFDERVNATDIFESQAYTSLMQVGDDSFVVTYNKYWPKLFNGESGCQGADPTKVGCSTGFAMRISLRPAPPSAPPPPPKPPPPPPPGPAAWLTWHAPVILHGGQVVQSASANITLDGNESVPDSFFALGDRNLFGHYSRNAAFSAARMSPFIQSTGKCRYFLELCLLSSVFCCD